MFDRGIYGIRNLNTMDIVYIGSTNISFISRWSYHAENTFYKTHYNERLFKLLESGKFEFIVIESGEFNSKELLEKERYYTEKYNVVKNGYCIYVGGGSIKEASSFKSTVYEVDENIKALRKYIYKMWYNKKMYKEDKEELGIYLKEHGIESSKFMVTLRKLGFIVQRYADKKSCIITDKSY